MNTPRDNNRIPTMLGTLNTDGITPVSITVDPTSHALKVSDGTTGSSLSFVNAQRDENRVPTMWGVSSTDGTTIIPIYCNSDGAILTKST